MTERRFDTTKLSKVMNYGSYLKLAALMEHDQRKARYRILPVKWFTQTRPSRLLTAVVIHYVKINGGHAKEQSQGSMRKERGEWKFNYTGGNPGEADILVQYGGRVMECEIKIGRDKQSDSQIAFQKKMEKVGTPYVIIKDFDQFIEIFKQFKTQ